MGTAGFIPSSQEGDSRHLHPVVAQWLPVLQDRPLRSAPVGFPWTRTRRPSERGTVAALVAHDAKKEELLRLVEGHLAAFASLHLIATGSTGTLLAEQLGLPIERMASGPQGGDLQIGARIAHGEVDAVFFLRDPLTPHPHEPDMQALLKVCDVHQVPFATNAASAEILIRHLSRDRKRLELVHPSLQE